MADLKVVQGGFHKGHWQSDRDFYPDDEIEVWNAIFRELSEKHNPAWKEWIWELKEPPALQVVK